MRAVIFDIDGTLADVAHRLHHLDGEKDWNAFFRDMADDAPVEPIARLARMLHHNAESGRDIDAVLIVTARPDRADWRRTTLDWLALHKIPYDALYMRAEGDIRADHLVKADMLQRILDDGYAPVLVIDDRPQVVRMWRDHGITTLQCAPDEPGASAYAGETLLHLLVGPCGAGKSTYAAKTYQPHDIVSTDALRLQLYGNLGHAPEALRRVWKLAHGLLRARLDAGVFTVLDATNLRAEDRLRVLDALPRGVFARYVIIDRDLGEKLRDRDWRSEDLVMKQHRLFRAEERNILLGDAHPWVQVQDRRTR
ncbi:AAA family ATPase [Sphingosinicella sp. BN140058]|uniref:phosphatase domain-containing protein n=1 Tax=Sphingosinicella sp. BN140058 TaxID=1892855 RepID=UPI0013E9A902|nr:AAA family ATPase [Sphingosinicella sp. BN140058]